jgi:hypothetical protein
MAAMIIGEFTYGAAGNGFTDHVTVPAERVIDADTQRNNISAHPAKML